MHSSAAREAHHAAEDAAFLSNPHQWMPWLAGTLGLVGIGIAWYFHLARRKAADDLKLALMAHGATRWLPTALENKWYVDELYHATIRAPLWLLGHVLQLWDRYVLDMGIIDGVARLPRALGKGFQPLANGVLQSYAVSMVGGVGLVAVLVFVMPDLIEWLRSLSGGAG
jgi:NADH-quinone oxidoreductase subunit L